MGQYATVAAQVPDDFRFAVKAPSVVNDALVRGEAGRAMQANPAFLSPQLAVNGCVQPALDGDPDPETREALTKVALATAAAGLNAYITISNKAEGSAPLSVRALAEEIQRQQAAKMQPPE